MIEYFGNCIQYSLQCLLTKSSVHPVHPVHTSIDGFKCFHTHVPVEIELLLANHKFKSCALTYGKEMYTDHWLVPGGLPENSAASLHGIAVIRVRHKSTNAT